jgi:hypothetical protein
MSALRKPSKQMPEFILGVDPGELTGLAFLHTRAPLTSFGGWELDLYQGGALIKDICEQCGPRLHVVCEQFTISMRTVKNTPTAHYSIEMIGVARYFCQVYTGWDLTLYEQKPPFSTDDRLKAMGWYHPTPNGHLNDAGRQVLKHLVECGFRDDLLWPEKSTSLR